MLLIVDTTRSRCLRVPDIIAFIDYGSTRSRLLHAVGLSYPERTAVCKHAAVLLNARELR